jgi:hypothetical protein
MKRHERLRTGRIKIPVTSFRSAAILELRSGPDVISLAAKGLDLIVRLQGMQRL